MFSENLAKRREQAEIRLAQAKNMTPILNMASEMMPDDKLTQFTKALLELEIKQTQERIALMDAYKTEIEVEEIRIENGTYLRGQ